MDWIDILGTCEPWKVGSGGNRGGEQVSPQKTFSADFGRLKAAEKVLKSVRPRKLILEVYL